MKMTIRFIKKIWLRFRYREFISGVRPLKISIKDDILANKYAPRNMRMMKIGSKVFMTTFECVEINKDGQQIGHYLILYKSQYVSFKSYYELSLLKDANIKVQY